MNHLKGLNESIKCSCIKEKWESFKPLFALRIFDCFLCSFFFSDVKPLSDILLAGIG